MATMAIGNANPVLQMYAYYVAIWLSGFGMKKVWKN